MEKKVTSGQIRNNSYGLPPCYFTTRNRLHTDLELLLAVLLAVSARFDIRKILSQVGHIWFSFVPIIQSFSFLPGKYGPHPQKL